MSWDDKLILCIICPQYNAYKEFAINNNLEIEEGWRVSPTKNMFFKPEKRRYGFGKSGHLICKKCGEMIGQYKAPSKTV